MSLDKTYRFSFATFSKSVIGEKEVASYSPSVSLSMADAKKLGRKKEDRDVGDIKLARFWNRIGRNQFCLPDGGVISSETKLTDYFTSAEHHYTAELHALASNHILTICYKETVAVPDANKTGDTPLDLKLHTFENKAGEFHKLPDASAIDPNAIATAVETVGSRPGKMGTDDWNEVLVVNNLLNGFCIDRVNQTIIKARKTAFKLEPNPLHPLMFSPGTLPAAGIADLRQRAKDAVNTSPLKAVERGLKSAFIRPAAENPSKPSELAGR